MNRSRFALISAMLLITTTGPLAAQSPVVRTTPVMRVGANVSYNFEAEEVGIGGRIEHSLSNMLGGTAVDGIGEVNWFIGDVDIFDFNYNIVYRFAAPSVTPYLGGGLNFQILTGFGNTESDLHLNGVAGLRFIPLGKVTPLLQLRYVFAGQGDQLIMTGGILF